MLNKYLAIGSSIFTLLFSCNKDSNEQQAISNAIDSFYAAEPVGNYRHANHRFLSADLVDLLRKSSKVQSTDSARLKAAGSTDKPLMIEGDIFTSVLEGSTSHTVEEILLYDEEKKSGIKSHPQALATVKFCNQHYDNYTWRDTVEMVQDQGEWKIRDIRYTKGSGAQPTLQKTLLEFLKLEITQSIE